MGETREDREVGNYSECNVLIVDGGSFGKRVENELKSKNIEGIRLISSDKNVREKNILYKTLVHTASSAAERQQYHSDYSLKTDLYRKIDWEYLRNRIKEKAEEIRKKEVQRPTYSVVEKGGKIYINNEECRAKNIVVVNPVEEEDTIDFANVWIKLVEMEAIPFQVFIKGSDKYAVEAASIFSDLGSKVYLSSTNKTLLSRYDLNVQESVKSLLLDKGVTLFLNSEIDEISRSSQSGVHSVTLKLESGMAETVKKIDLFLEEEDYQQEERIDSQQKTVKVYEPAKKIGHSEKALLSSMYPDLFTRELLDIPIIPSFIYTNPPAATVGCTEEEAKHAKKNIRIVNPKFRGLFYSVCQNKVPTDYKLIFESKTEDGKIKEKLIGLHLFGKSSIDGILGFLFAMHTEISPEQILQTIPIHPTSSEELIAG